MKKASTYSPLVLMLIPVLLFITLLCFKPKQEDTSSMVQQKGASKGLFSIILK